MKRNFLYFFVEILLNFEVWKMSFELLRRALELSLDQCRESVSTLHVIQRNEHRPWLEFLRAFNIPKRKRSMIEKRVFTNLVYYRVNYIELYVMLMLFGIIALSWPIALVQVHLTLAVALCVLTKLLKLTMQQKEFQVTTSALIIGMVFLLSKETLISLTVCCALSGKPQCIPSIGRAKEPIQVFVSEVICS